MKSIKNILMATILLLSSSAINAQSKNLKIEIESIVKSVQEEKSLTTVFNTYFELKEALVQTDSKLASKKADALLVSIEKVDMSTLEMDAHMVWMKVLKPLKDSTKAISDSKNVEDQRKQFSVLSDEMYKIMKISKLEDTVYFQHCPMANRGKGANWLSKEEKIKNPYYGEKMLNCGKTVETIK